MKAQILQRILIGLLLAIAQPAFGQAVDERERTIQMALQLANNAVDGLNAAVKGLTTALENARQPIIVGGHLGGQQDQQPAVSPLAEACSDGNYLRCGIQFLASGGESVKELFKAAVGIAPFVSNYKIAKHQTKAQMHGATEARLTNADNQETLQVFGNGLAAAATAPREPAQVYNVTGSQGIAFGGSVDWSPVTNSNNPVNPNPKTCFPTYGAGGVITGWACP